MAESFTKGKRCRYSGSAAMALRGRLGTVEHAARKNNNGWVRVRFDGDAGTTPCSPYSLSLTMEDGSPVPPKPKKEKARVQAD